MPHINVRHFGFFLQQIVDSSSFSNKVWGIRWNFVSLPVCLGRCSWLLCARTELRQSRWVDLIVASLCCMSVSQTIPLTPGNINIPEPPLIYLAHLLLDSWGQGRIAHLYSLTHQVWLVAGRMLQYGLDTLTPWLLIKPVWSGRWGHRHS